MMKITLMVVIITLLASIVGYLALDRHEKNEAIAKEKAFNEKFFGRSTSTK